jgi:hypothetical protein
MKRRRRKTTQYGSTNRGRNNNPMSTRIEIPLKGVKNFLNMPE